MSASRPVRAQRPWVRAILSWSLALLTAIVPAGAAAAAPCWRAPVEGAVVDPFRAPACPWCPGNRGLEYRVRAGAVVRAVGAGEVVFAGSVAGVGYVVVSHADGHRTTYGRLTERAVRRGQRVAAGARVGVAAGTFHFGVRLGDRYLDPAPLLGELVGRPRLVPVDGTPRRPAGPPRLRCTTGAERR